jgi:hypothetical protein
MAWNLQIGNGPMRFGNQAGETLQQQIERQTALQQAAFVEQQRQADIAAQDVTSAAYSQLQGMDANYQQISETAEPWAKAQLYQQVRGGVDPTTAAGSVFGMTPEGQRRQQLQQVSTSLAVETQKANLAAARANAQAGNLKLQAIASGEMPPDERIGIINTWSDDWINASGDAREVLISRRQALNSLETDNSLGALAAVIKLAKVLDPGSVVRSEEGRAVTDGMGASLALVNAFNKMKGENMSAESRIAFRDVINAVVEPQALMLQDMAAGYNELAQRWNINPDDIFRGTLDQRELQSALPIMVPGPQ